MTYRKKLIEVALPLEAISDASAAEKRNPFLKGHPRQMHVWWARRPLAACRAVIFTSLVDDPDDPDAPPEFVEACRKLPRGKNAAENDTPRQRLFDFIETLVQWDSKSDEGTLMEARRLISLSTDGNPPALFDPFAGGGSIPLEGCRLGLTAHAGDLNPVSVAINKALIEVPQRFVNLPPVNPRARDSRLDGTWSGLKGLAADVRYYASRIQKQAEAQIGDLYPVAPTGETVFAWLWARTIRCPNPACGAEIPLISSYDLRTKSPPVSLRPLVDKETRTVAFEVLEGRKSKSRATKVGRGVHFKCLVCDEVAGEDHIKNEAANGRMSARLLALVTEGKRGRRYYSADELHEKTAKEAAPTQVPNLQMSTHPQYMAPVRYGMTTFADLFTARQLLTLDTFSSLVDDVRDCVFAHAVGSGMSDDRAFLRDGGSGAWAYAEGVTLYLSLALSSWINYMSTLSAWNKTNGNLKNAFSRQAMIMTWDFAENNPFNSTLSFEKPVEWIARILEDLPSSLADGCAVQMNAMEPVYEKQFMFSTDPPYYDNVPYADLSDLFYIYLRRNLSEIYPSLFGTLLVPKETELVADRQRLGSTDAANKYFEDGIEAAFSRMRAALDPRYPMTVYYAFKQVDIPQSRATTSSRTGSGWETMLEGLINAGLTISGTWPMRTERPTGLKIGMNVLASSVVLACRARPATARMASRREFLNALRVELPSALREMQSANIAPVDLAQASIGPGMAVYSRYNKVLEPNGDRLTVRAALQIINHELDAYLAEQEGYIDADSRFAIAWFEQFGFKEGIFGQADVLARAKNTSVDGLADAGVLESGVGRVRLYRWSELDPGWDPSNDERLSVWEAVHHLIERLNVYGEEGAARLLAKMPSDLAAQARQLAYRLYSICERKGWAEHARDYNALVISWGASQEQARAFKEQHQQIDMFSS